MRDADHDFGALFCAEADAFFRTALRMLRDPEDAEDAVQDAFIRLSRRGDRPSDFDNQRAWAFCVLRSVCLDRLRARRRRASDRSFDEERDASADLTTPETMAINAERLTLVEAAIGRLPELEAEAFSLVVVEGLSYADVAAATRTPIGTVRSRLHRARSRLREMLETPPAVGGAVVAFPRNRE